MATGSRIQRERRRHTENRYAACHVDNLGNLHIVDQLRPSIRSRPPLRPYSQPDQLPNLAPRRTKTVRFSLENYSNSNSARSSANKPLPSTFFLQQQQLQLGNGGGAGDLKPLPQAPAPVSLDIIDRKPLPPPPPKDHVAQVLECKRVSIQRLKTPQPRRLSPRSALIVAAEKQEREDEEDVVALVKVYRPPRRVRIHWLRVLKDRRRIAFPIVLILVPTRKMPDRVSKVLVVGQGRRPGTYQEPDLSDFGGGGGIGGGGGGDRMTFEADMRYSRRPKSTPERWRPRMVAVPEAPRRVSTPDLAHPGTRWMD